MGLRTTQPVNSVSSGSSLLPPQSQKGFFSRNNLFRYCHEAVDYGGAPFIHVADHENGRFVWGGVPMKADNVFLLEIFLNGNGRDKCQPHVSFQGVDETFCAGIDNRLSFNSFIVERPLDRSAVASIHPHEENGLSLQVRIGNLRFCGKRMSGSGWNDRSIYGVTGSLTYRDYLIGLPSELQYLRKGPRCPRSEARLKALQASSIRPAARRTTP